MIVLYFIIDYLVMLFLPINTCFIVLDIDKNKISNIFIIGIIFDILYSKYFLFTCFVLVLYLFIKLLKIKRKYRLVMNTFIYLLFFIIMNKC